MKKLVEDAFGIARVLGFRYAVRWTLAAFVRCKDVMIARNLQPADQAMGAGPFQVNLPAYGAQFRVVGAGVFSGIREMYVRDAYLRRHSLRINDGDVVLDLGANMGNFTNLALAHGPKVRVIAVEPNKYLNQAFGDSVALNQGFPERTTLIRAFLGARDIGRSLANSEEYEGALILSEGEFVRASGIRHVDFLKCDIEGGEFEVFKTGSALLRMTDSLAIEIHAFAGDVDGFIKMLIDHGFVLRHIKRDADGTATVLAAKG